MLTTLVNNINGNVGGIVADGAGYATSTSTFPGTYPGLVSKTDNGGPKAYLNWLVFNKDFVFLSGGFRQLSSTAREAGTNVPHELLQSPAISITQPGYVYIYLSNENPTQVDVYFDDFKVVHTKSPVIQSNDNFAHGMDNSALSYQRENSTKNNFLYNAGSEVQSSIDQNIYDMPYRGLDVSIGRMMQVDPLADKYASHSTYNYAFNDPVFWNDPMGNEPPEKKNRVREEEEQRIIDRMFENNRRMYGVIGDDDLNGSGGWGRAFEKIGPGNSFFDNSVFFTTPLGDRVSAQEVLSETNPNQNSLWRSLAIDALTNSKNKNESMPGADLIKEYEANYTRAWAAQFVGQALLENGVGGNIIKSIRNEVADITNPDKKVDVARANQIMNLATQMVKTALSFVKNSKYAAPYLSAVGAGLILDGELLKIKNDNFVGPKIMRVNPDYYNSNIQRIYPIRGGGGGASYVGGPNGW
ncbi:MAG: hypothetical protein K2U26_08105 [Cyclobacteriaceae bacterium]|nr:hypothetical protein [Cyclobacteriaceae bacterium]